MVKQGTTKEHILRLIYGGMNNLSDISKTLDLAPSTVSKHLHDLEDIGAIEQEENEHFKKWKYYRIRQPPQNSAGGFSARPEGSGGFGSNRNMFLGAIVAIAFVLIGGAAYLAIGHAPKTASVGISITDPPKVPYGTQALYVNYSSLDIMTSYNGETKWMPINISGRVDLMGLINYSQFIGSANIAEGSKITGIKLNISSANITIDNQTYPVAVQQPQISAYVQNSTKIAGASSMLLDFSPVVMQLYSNGSQKYILMPSVRAVVIGGGMGEIAPDVGYKAQLPVRYMESFPNPANVVKVNSAVMEREGNNTSFTLSLTNTGKSNISIFGILIYNRSAQVQALGNNTPGNGTIGAMPIGPGMAIRVGWPLGAQPRMSPNGSFSYNASADGIYMQSGSNISINATKVFALSEKDRANSLSIRLNRSVNTIIIVRIDGTMHAQPYAQMQGIFMPNPLDVACFIVLPNGTITTFQRPGLHDTNSMPGFLIAPNATREISYAGNLNAYGDMFPGRAIANGTAYRMVIITNAGPVQTNVTLS